MQAIVKAAPEPGVEVRDVAEPQVGPDEVCVQVRAAAICGADLKLYKWDRQTVRNWPRLRDMQLPHVIGHEAAGQVVETGKNVRDLKVGDHVAAETHFPCQACELCRSDRMHLCRRRKILGFDTAGGFAQYLALPQKCAVKLPDGLCFEAGALCEPFGVATHALEQAGSVQGRTAWVLGCGSIGLFIVKLLNDHGAKTILATDTQPARLDWAKQLGATVVPAGEGVVEQVLKMADGQGAELVFEVVGVPATVQQALAAVAPGGRVMLVGTFGGTTPIDVAANIIYREATVCGVYGRHMFDTWNNVFDTLGSGRFDLQPFMTSRFGFSQAKAAFETALSGVGVKTLLFPDAH